MHLPPIPRRRALKILERLLRVPTAPFHEHRVRRKLVEILGAAGIRTAVDRYGNLTARYRRGKAKPVALSAHMDHPGFEIVKVDGTRAEGKWNGQVPTFDLRGIRLALWSDCEQTGRRGTAKVLAGDGRPRGPLPGTPGAPRRRPVSDTLTLRVPRGTRPGDFGYADVTPFALRGGKIISKCLDNVGGCGAIAAALVHLASRRLPGDVVALFTRAEEVGFHGAFGAIAARTVALSRPLVVLECSQEMPGALMGRGPVIRVGDRARVFDPDTASACEAAANVLMRRRKGFRYQRRLMDGGTCEGTAFGLAGYPTVGFAFPLGNYHNIGSKGLAAEFISEADFLRGVDCLAAFAVVGVDRKGAKRRLSAWVSRRFGPAQRTRLRKTA